MKVYKLSYNKFFLSGIFKGQCLPIVEEIRDQRLAFLRYEKVKKDQFFDLSGNLCKADNISLTSFCDVLK